MMKKYLIMTILAFSLLVSPAFAAENKDGGVIGDDNSVNGGVDLITENEVNHENKLKEVSARKQSKAGPVLILGVSHQTQANNYYCGPASVSMIAKYLGYNVSQSQAASYLGTTTNGTDAGPGVANGLRAAINYSANYEWVWHTYTDINTIKSRIYTDIQAGYPVLINTAEGPGDAYLSGHNNGSTIYHFGVVDGYNDYVDGGHYLDPGYGYFSGFVREQTASFHDLSYAAGGRGYVW